MRITSIQEHSKEEIMKIGKIISGIMLAIAYISLIVAGFMDGLKEGLIVLSLLTASVSLILFGITRGKD